MNLTEFIKENNLTFEVGERNTNITVLCGYALHKNYSIEDCKNAILTTEYEYDRGDIFPEIERVYEYARANKYGDWWTTQTTWKV